MHGKRRQILDILKERGSATVEELRRELGITSVTVRHHLDILRAAGLVAEPTVRHRSSPGRPRHEYTLTREAENQFPKNYAPLALHLIDEMKSRFDGEEIDVIFEGLSERLLSGTLRPAPEASLTERMEFVVGALNEKGYVARWEHCDEGALLFTSNCPYDGVAREHPELCHMDLGVISTLAGIDAERVRHRATGDDTCSYLIRGDGSAN